MGKPDVLFSTRACASEEGNPGRDIESPTTSPKPPSDLGPMPTEAVTEVSGGTFGPPCKETSFIEPMKQAAYPAANNCSGLFPGPPGPPNSFGVVSFTSRLPSLVAARPSRPPIAVACVVYRTFTDIYISCFVKLKWIWRAQ